MLGRLSNRLTFANVVAMICLFVVLGGTSVASDATQSAVKLITGKQIKNNSIASGDVKNESLTGGDVKNGSLLSQDFGAGQLPAGPQGPQGDRGPAGAPNPNADNSDRLDGKDSSEFLAADGVPGKVTTHEETISIAAGQTVRQFADCAASGATAVGGGAHWAGSTTEATNGILNASGPWGARWRVVATNDEGSPLSLTVQVVCVNP